MTHSSLIYVLILNWNGWKDTLECLESVFRVDYPNYIVVVCDNGSQDESLDRIAAWADGLLDVWIPSENPLRALSFPPVKKPIPYAMYRCENIERNQATDRNVRLVLVQNGANLGFAGGNNVGLRYILSRSDFSYVWLLNNDTVVSRDALMHAVRRLDADDRNGICGSTLLFYGEPQIVQGQGGASYNKWLGTNRHLGGRRSAQSLLDREEVEAKMDYVIGASMLVSEGFLRRVGLLCEDYFFFYEELDWAKRARDEFRLTYSPESVVFHKEGATAGTTSRGRNSLIADYYMLRNRLVFARKYHVWSIPCIYASIFASLLRRIIRGQWDRVGFIVALLFGLDEVIRPSSLDQKKSYRKES